MNKIFQKLKFHVSCFMFHVSSSIGFTLLEILVVIGIIMILVGLGFASYSTAQKKARDAKRKSDIHAIQNAVEQYYSICNLVYPAAPLGDEIHCVAPATVIMPTVPVDPKDSTVYTYSIVGSGYTLCTSEIESETTTDYCVQSQQ